MEENVEVFVSALTTNTLSDDILPKITDFLKKLDIKNLLHHSSEHFHILCILEHWAWRILSEDPHQWINDAKHVTLFRCLASFNKNLIFNSDETDSNAKALLLLPEVQAFIKTIFEQLRKINDENHPYFTMISLWLNNLAYFIREHTQFLISPIMIDINHYIVSDYIMSDQYKHYLVQLEAAKLIFTKKQIFYIRTCSLFISSYCFSKDRQFAFTGDEILRCLSDDYLKIIYYKSLNVHTWSKDLLSCLTHLISFICTCCCLDGDKAKHIEILLPTEEACYEYIQSLIRIISYKGFHNQIQNQRSNDETILIDVILSFLLGIIHTYDLVSFMRSETNLLEILLPLAPISSYNPISLCAYGLLGEILCDEHLKEVKITNNICEYFFYMLEQAWNHRAEKSQRIILPQLLRGFLSLAKNDAIQQKVADTNKVLLFIEICDKYPIAYDILWALSFNQNIQEQLRSNQKLMVALAHLKQELHHEPMRKITYGLLWNLRPRRETHDTMDKDDETTFDIMISYSHRDKTFCKQLYDELIKGGYRVWIDFDQIHGNVMDAMAKAIERSSVVLICMSEQYRRSNYCRAEANYAFQRRVRIVPILIQEHYKPDGWLLFLVGQLLYVDFTKNEFSQAMEMLIKEIKAFNLQDDTALPRPSRDYTNILASSLSIPQTVSSQTTTPFNDNIQEWSQHDVHSWLVKHNLMQMSRILVDYDGASLMYFYNYLSNGELKQIFKLLEEDSLRRTRQSISLVELARLQNLLTQQVQHRPIEPIVRQLNSYPQRIKHHRSNLCRIL